jgi:hypothetical protein
VFSTVEVWCSHCGSVLSVVHDIWCSCSESVFCNSRSLVSTLWIFFFLYFLKIDLTIGITSTVPNYKPTVLAMVNTLT